MENLKNARIETSEEQILIYLNGKRTAVEKGSILKLLEKFNINPDNCIVMLNDSLLDSDELSSIDLKDKDMLELAQFIGGG